MYALQEVLFSVSFGPIVGLFWTYSRSLLRSLLIYMYALQEVLFSNLFVRVRINTGSDVNV